MVVTRGRRHQRRTTNALTGNAAAKRESTQSPPTRYRPASGGCSPSGIVASWSNGVLIREASRGGLRGDCTGRRRSYPSTRPSRPKGPRRCGDLPPRPARTGFAGVPTPLGTVHWPSLLLPSTRPSRPKGPRRCGIHPPRPAPPGSLVCPRRSEPCIGRSRCFPSTRPSRQKGPRRCGSTRRDLHHWVRRCAHAARNRALAVGVVSPARDRAVRKDRDGVVVHPPRPAPLGLLVCPRRSEPCIGRCRCIPSTRPSRQKGPPGAPPGAGVPSRSEPHAGCSPAPTEPSEGPRRWHPRDLHHWVRWCAHAARNRALAVLFLPQHATEPSERTATVW